ncbi:MAG: L,D-transpeptidase family protein [Succinivibrio sp.]|jgi:L,D-transpeptidase YbiS|nr:L,D-transpeptidase family protein [Succinivibrio sp.]
MQTVRSMILAASLFAAAGAANAGLIYPVSDSTRMVGEEQIYKIDREGTTTMEYVAAKYKLGLSNMIEANPKVDPIVPRRGTELVIPQRVILPDAPHEGIVVNSAEMRLFYYRGGQVEIFPIGIGQLGKGTPISWVTKVERKKAGPTWTPTAAMRAEYAAAGDPLPAVVPAGPDNPMGLYAMYVGKLFAIHGTNADFGIGLRVSHGCVRLRNEDNEVIWHEVPVGTRVQFTNQPIKHFTAPDGGIYIEVHQPLSRTSAEFDSDEANTPFSFTADDLAFFKTPGIDQDILERALRERSGRPVLLNPAQF